MATSTNGTKVDVKLLVEWGFKIVTVVLLPLMIWIVTLLIELDKRVSIMEGNQFTSGDGIEMREDISTLQTTVTEMKDDINSLESCQIKLRVGKADSC